MSGTPRSACKLGTSCKLPLTKSSANCFTTLQSGSFFKVVPRAFMDSDSVDDMELEVFNVLKFMSEIDPGHSFTVRPIQFHKATVIDDSEVVVPDQDGDDRAIESQEVKLMSLHTYVTKAAQVLSQRDARAYLCCKSISRLILPFVRWYVGVSDKYKLEHNDMHVQNVVFDTETNTLRLIDFGRLSMASASANDPRWLQRACTYTGRTLSFQELRNRLVRKGITAPVRAAPWCNDMARYLATMYLAISSKYPGLLELKWGAQLDRDGLVLDPQLETANDIASSIEKWLDDDHSDDPGFDLEAVLTIGIAPIAIALVQLLSGDVGPRTIMTATKEGRAAIDACTRIDGAPVMPLEALRTMTVFRAHTCMNPENLQCVRAVYSAVNAHMDTMRGGDDDAAISDEDEDEDAAAIADDEDDDMDALACAVMADLHPTSLDQAFAQKGPKPDLSALHAEMMRTPETTVMEPERADVRMPYRSELAAYGGGAGRYPWWLLMGGALVVSGLASVVNSMQ